MGAIPDREGGSFLTQRSDQRNGRFQEGFYTKIQVDQSGGAGHPDHVEFLAQRILYVVNLLAGASMKLEFQKTILNTYLEKGH